MGNRHDHLQYAVNEVFEKVGTISRISAVYKTPAIGFDGPYFLNCVIEVLTNYTPKQVLKKVLRIEKNGGRVRDKNETYASRPIDIDILLYDDEVIVDSELQVPHPRLQDRRFVLQPLAEINGAYQHPVLKKSCIQLLAQTGDTTVIEKQSKWLRNPQRDFDFSKLNYIAIEGNIGAGKTSLAHLMTADFNAKLILERFKDNPFLPKFYEDQARYAFPLEMSFLADRYQQLLDDITQFDLFKDCVIADYDAYKSLIFAKVTLQDEEYNLYKKLFSLMHKELPKPEMYIYLYQNTARLLENIKKRGRSYEKGIKADYLMKINEGYLEFIKNQHDKNIKIIDISSIDFVKNREDYVGVLREILS